jgi:hypothetical protein
MQMREPPGQHTPKRLTGQSRLRFQYHSRRQTNRLNLAANRIFNMGMPCAMEKYTITARIQKLSAICRLHPSAFRRDFHFCSKNI